MKPWAHQIEDTATLVREPYHFLGLGPGLGKSRIVVDAAHRLFLAGEIDTLIVVAPAPGRSVWADPDPVLGEFTKWIGSCPHTLHEYKPETDLKHLGGPGLTVLVTNPEFIRPRSVTQRSTGTTRRIDYLKPLITWASKRRAFLAVDESWQYQNPTAKQTKAVTKLRQACVRVALLNGTPGEPRHLYAQFQILDPDILKCRSFAQFRDCFCTTGGYMGKEITGYQNLETFRQWTAPHITVREARECVDLGPEPVRTQIEARLTPATWKHYVAMRDDMVAWLSESEASVAGQAGVKALRLAQIVNGFLGGVETAAQDLLEDEWPRLDSHTTKEIGREKLDALTDWLADNWRDPKLVVFTRFRADVERTARTLANALKVRHEVVKIYGGQSEDERRRAKELLAPGGDPKDAIAVVNTISGGAMLNFAAAQLAVFLGHDYALRVRQQAEKRVDRYGQTGRVTFLDILATGPNGEKTIDHVIVAAHRRAEDLLAWTPEKWRAALLGEEPEQETEDIQEDA